MQDLEGSSNAVAIYIFYVLHVGSGLQALTHVASDLIAHLIADS